MDLLFVGSGGMDVIGTAADAVPETRMRAMLFQATAEDHIRVLEEHGSADRFASTFESSFESSRLKK
jgi:hypothetical protein